MIYDWFQFYTKIIHYEEKKIMSCHTSMSALWSDGSRCSYNSHKPTNIIITRKWPNIEQETGSATPTVWYALFLLPFLIKFIFLSGYSEKKNVNWSVSHFPTIHQLLWDCECLILSVWVPVPSATTPLPQHSYVCGFLFD